MDQILERLERLVRAWFSSAMGEDVDIRSSERSGMFHDPDLADAWEELENYLNPDDTERKKRSQTTRSSPFSERVRSDDFRDAFRETSGKFGSSSGQQWSRAAEDHAEQERKAVMEAYRFLGLEPFCPFSEVKARYKELLKKHHPDRHTSSAENLQKATAISAKINAAYQLIETWEQARHSSS